jgi:aminopeptidase N
LDPKAYVELVVRNLTVQSASFSLSRAGERRAKARTLNAETDESTIQTLLARVSTAMNYYLSDAQRTAVAPLLEDALIDRLQHAETAGQRITFYRAFVANASTERSRNVLKQMLADGGRTKGRNPSGSEGATTSNSTRAKTTSSMPLRTKDKFDIVTRLIILGDPEASQLLANLEKTESGDDAKRYAYAARAGFATAENKAKYWNDFVNNKDISESWIEAAFGPFNTVRQGEVSLPYLERALAELPNLKRNRKIFFVNGWLGAFIGGQRSPEALAIVNEFLADNPNLDNDLRLKILENVDLIERAVKIRSKYARS